MAARKEPHASVPRSEPKLTAGRRHESGTIGAVRRATVLVIDDEARLAKVVALVLEAYHDVDLTTDPLEALKRIESGERFDLLLCDLMMPNMTGMELYHAIARISPQQANRMAFMSGNAFQERAIAFLRSVPNPWIEKPFNEQELLDFVRNSVIPK